VTALPRLPLLLAVIAVTVAQPALGAWVVDEHGDCVETWTPDSLLRGPTAIINAPLVPVRSAIGGVRMARGRAGLSGYQGTVLLPPLLAVGGGATGLVEGLIWAVSGLADTVTGGALALAPAEATRLSVEPMTPLGLGPGRAPVDHCGGAARAH
jgi:hypothetical protein